MHVLHDPANAFATPADQILPFDVCLYSSDGQQFWISRWILMEASAAFRPSLFQTPSSSSSRTTTPSFHHIVLSEPALTLEPLLQLLAPTGNPQLIQDLETLKSVLAAAIEYGFLHAVEALRRMLLDPFHLDPQRFGSLRIYAIACEFGLEHEAREASRATLKLDLSAKPLVGQLRNISAWHYCQLLRFHEQRANRMVDVIEKWRGRCLFRCGGCFSPSTQALPDLGLEYGGKGTESGVRWSIVCPRWWRKFCKRAKKQVHKRPLTDIIFSVPFLSACARSGCRECGQSIMDSWVYMRSLQKELDAIPDTM